MPTDQNRRFTILRHEPGAQGPRPLHWDLLLEWNGVLRAWALESEPRRGTSAVATALPDHRLEYLEYEGPLSRQRGVVTRFDSGVYEILREGTQLLIVRLSGRLLSCELMLAAAADGHQWTASFSATG